MSCQLITLTAYATAPSNLDGEHWVSIEYKPYYQWSWSFPYTVPEGHQLYVTDILFQAKNIPGQRPNYLVLDGLYTLTSDIGHIPFATPLIVPAGFKITGRFDNNTSDTAMNMIAMVKGVLADSFECWRKWK